MCPRDSRQLTVIYELFSVRKLVTRSPMRDTTIIVHSRRHSFNKRMNLENEGVEVNETLLVITEDTKAEEKAVAAVRMGNL
jgi:hypothetical protein